MSEQSTPDAAEPAEGPDAGSGAASETPATSGAPETPETPEAAVPPIRIEAGDPSPEQVAVLVAVLSALGGEPEPEPERRSAWSDPGRRLGGGRGWALSGLPR